MCKQRSEDKTEQACENASVQNKNVITHLSLNLSSYFSEECSATRDTHKSRKHRTEGTN